MPGSTNPWASELKARKSSSIRNTKSGNQTDPDPEIRDTNLPKFFKSATPDVTPQAETRGAVPFVREEEVSIVSSTNDRGTEEIRRDEKKEDGRETNVQNEKKDQVDVLKTGKDQTKAERMGKDIERETQRGDSERKVEANKNDKGANLEIKVERRERERDKLETDKKEKNMSKEAGTKNNETNSKMDEKVNDKKMTTEVRTRAEDSFKTKAKTLPDEGAKTNLYLDARNQLKRVVTRQISRPSVGLDDDYDDCDDDMTPIDRLIRQGSFEPVNSEKGRKQVKGLKSHPYVSLKLQGTSAIIKVC